MNRLKIISVMLIWGSLGVFTKTIPLSALNLAFLRALFALPVLFIAMRLKRSARFFNWRLYKPYFISGILLGFGWLTLFYGFKNTSISSAVVIYNMCPVYVMIAAPFLLKEKLSSIQVIVICLSFFGLFLIVGQNIFEGYGILGMLLSAVSGMIYAAIVLINRGIKDRVDNQTGTFVQISMAMFVLLPFVLLDGNIADLFKMDAYAVFLTVLLGVLHTGIAYTLFFSVCEHMRSIEVVTYSYFEPLFGIIFGIIFIGERMTLIQILGAVLILGSTYVGEMIKNKKAKKDTIGIG